MSSTKTLPVPKYKNCLHFIHFSFAKEFFRQHTFLNLMSLENISRILSSSGTNRTRVPRNQMWHSFQRFYDNFSVPSHTRKEWGSSKKTLFSPVFRELSRSVSFNLNFNKTQPHALCKRSQGIPSCAFDNHALVLEAGVKSCKTNPQASPGVELRESETSPVSKALNHSRKRRTWFPTCSAAENFLRLSANYETVRQKFSSGFRLAEKFILAEWK